MTITTDPSVAAQGGQGADLGPYVSSLHSRWLTAASGRTWDRVPGSLVFADVSGFTPLAERLARRGKVGAEELTDTLNLVFTALLDVATRFGGDCLKFGGDALLLFFSGPGHERRASAAAHGMDAALRSLRRQRTGAGLAKLGISMGVHSGALDGFLVGSSHRELVLAGPAVSSTLWLEAAAAAGQILLSDATAAALDLDDVEEMEGGLLRLRRAPTAMIPRPSEPVTHDVSTALPTALRHHLDGQRHDGEHRLASIGFVKFIGTDHLLAGDGPDQLAAALEALITCVQERTDEHGVTFVGTDVDRDGGKIILATGMPTASDDDEDRLLVTLREVLEAAEELPLLVRAGANRGRVFAVDLGSSSRRTFTVMGDAVNLAARVMGKAENGQLVATDALLDRRRTEFDLEPLTPFHVKGKSHPISAQVVRAPIGRRDADAADATPLIGRREQIASIRDAFAAAHHGEGRVVELVGEPGIGKSKLVSTVAALEHGLGRFAFEAGRYSRATPYFALRSGLRTAMGLTLDSTDDEVERALREVVERSTPDLVPWLPLLGIPLGIEIADTPITRHMDVGSRHRTLHQAVVQLMDKVLAHPTLITIEDAHWLDGASSELLASLLATVGRRPWAVLVTRRPVSGGLELADTLPVVRHHLGPLTGSDLAELATATAGDAVLPPGVLDDLVDRSGGNPLFLQELVNATVTGSLSEIPESIEAVVAATIDTLPAHDRTLLRHAAVLGGHVPVGVLAAMVDEPEAEVEQSIRGLRHFLREETPGSLRFRHILLRDVAYEGLPFRVRRAMHARAGEIFERSTPDPESIAELLAIHYDAADQPARSWRYSCVAGRRAQHNGATVEAAAFFERALAAARRLDDVPRRDQADVAERLGDTWELGGRYALASAAYRRSRKLSDGDPTTRVRLCRKLGYVRDHEGRYDTAQRWFRRGLSELTDVVDDTDSAELRAALMTAIVSSKWRQGRHARALPLIQEAIAHAQRSRARAALAHAYFVYDELLIDRGRYHDARHSELAAEIYEDLGDHRGAAAAYNIMGITAYWLGRWDDAVGCYERAIEADRKAGAIVYNAIYLNNIGEIRSDQGRLAEAESLLRDACDLWTAGGWRAGTGWALSNLGRLASREGRFGDSTKLLDDARAVLLDIGADGMLLETDARDMERLVFAGHHEPALAMAEELLHRAQRLGFPSVTALVERLQGYAYWQSGEPDMAWSIIESSVRACRARDSRYDLALGVEALARVGATSGRPEASRCAAEANELFTGLGVVSTPDVPSAASTEPESELAAP